MDDELLQSYEEAPYPSEPLYQTHPDALATAAFLAGMKPAPVDRCRVFEIGCGTGGNLIAMAASLPESKFLGIDLSPRQIEAGNQLIRGLGLTNIELHAADIMSLELGEQDYILCHGVYSWCPPAVQDRILAVCQERLAPDGVAYLSYNVLPGWRRLGVWRDVLQWGAHTGSDWRSRVRDGKRFLEEVAPLAERIDPHYAQNLRDAAKNLRLAPDEYVTHEHLEAFNEPIPFREMVSRAAGRGLQYLGESCRQTSAGELPESLRAWSRSRVELEQTLDLLRNASFRRSLFCRAGIALGEPTPEMVKGLRMNALCQPLSKDPDVASDKEEIFEAEKGQLSTDIPLVKAILVALHRVWPRTLSLEELAADVRVRLGATDDPDLGDEVVAEASLECYASNLVALHVWAPRFTMAPGERPLAGAMAREQARSLRRVTNLRHRIVELNVFEQALLRKLDGEHDRAALTEALVKDAEAGLFVIERGGRPVQGADAMRETIGATLPSTLMRLAHGALLVS